MLWHTHSHTHAEFLREILRSVMTLILLICSEISSDCKRSTSNLHGSTGAALACISYTPVWFKQQPLQSARGATPYYTFNKIFLITMQTFTEEKFCSLAMVAGEKSQLLQLIMCSDGLTDTQNCRSLVLTALLRGHLLSVKDFSMALDHFPAWDVQDSVPGCGTTATFMRNTRFH